MSFLASTGAGIGVSAAGAGISAAAAARQKQDAKAIAKFNRRLSLQNAFTTRQAAKEQQARERVLLKRQLAKNRALIAKGGVQQSGSPIEFQLEVIGDTAREIGLLGYNAEVQARGFEAQAEASRFQGQVASRAGTLAVGASLVGGAANIYSIANQAEINRTRTRGNT